MNRLALTSTTFAFLAVVGASALPAHAFTFTGDTTYNFSDLIGNSLVDPATNVTYSSFDLKPSTSFPVTVSFLKSNVGGTLFNVGGLAFQGAFGTIAGQPSTDYALSFNATAPSGQVIKTVGLNTLGNAVGGAASSVAEGITPNTLPIDAYYPAQGQNTCSLVYYPAVNQCLTPVSVASGNGSVTVTISKDIISQSPSTPGAQTQVSVLEQPITAGPSSNIPVPEPSEVLGTLAVGAIGVSSYLRNLQLKKQSRRSI